MLFFTLASDPYPLIIVIGNDGLCHNVCMTPTHAVVTCPIVLGLHLLFVAVQLVQCDPDDEPVWRQLLQHYLHHPESDVAREAA